MTVRPACPMRRHFAVAPFLTVALAWTLVMAPVDAAWAGSRATAVTRADDPVVVTGQSLEVFEQQPITDLALFRYNAATGTFVPVPYQIDQRVEHVFNPGQPYQITEHMYDIFKEDDGRLDDDDELVFLFGDAGPQAPQNAPWPNGSTADRYEIRAIDPRPTAPQADRFVYLFSGTGLERSTTQYVGWAMTPITAIDTVEFGLGFQDRWILDRLWIDPSCGTGEDLIDRVKGRGGLQIDRAETEEIWNPASLFLGGMLGPVRAIRYIRGAASGYNTIQSDVVYRGLWDRRINLRVHGISDVWLFIDMRPSVNETFFAPSVPNGVPVDGVNDSGIDAALPPWTMVRGPGGGFAIVYDVPPSPFVIDRLLYYRDDAAFNDAAFWPTYGDEDNASYGAHGIHLDGLVGTDTDTIPTFQRFFPLCANEGDAALGAALRELYDVPITTEEVLQGRTPEPVRNLLLQRDNADVLLGWLPSPGAITYRVYVAEDPDEPRGNWSLLAEVTATSYRDVGIAAVPVRRLYSVVAVTAQGEGPWD